MTNRHSRMINNKAQRSAAAAIAVLLMAGLVIGVLGCYTIWSVEAANQARVEARQQASAAQAAAAVGAQSDDESGDQTDEEIATPDGEQSRDDDDSDRAESFYENKGERPAWIENGSYFDSESQTQYLVVASEPRLKQREAEEELDEQLVQVVRDKVDDMFGVGAGKAIGIDLHYIRENLIQRHEDYPVDGVYVQPLRWRVPEDNRGMLESDVRDAFQCFAHVKLDPEFERWAEGRWENRLVVSRTMQTGLMALATLVFLTLVFGYFTAEHKTRGFYSRRLQTAGLAFLAIAGLAFWWLATQFAWL